MTEAANDTIDEIIDDETVEEYRARLDVEVELDELSAAHVADLVEKMLLVTDTLSGHELYPYQRAFAARIIESLIINDGATLTALFSRQSGKALELDTPIPTPTGWTRQGDLAAGDMVLSPTGKPVTVWEVLPVERGHSCYKITFDDETWIVAAARHEWVLHDGQRIETQDILDWPHPALPRIQVASPVELPPAELPIPPYTLGVWLGDGTGASGEITNPDIAVIERIRKDGFEVVKRPVEYAPYGWIVEGLRSRLREAGLLTRAATVKSTGRKHIPAAYLRGSIEQRKQLLAGIMDSDGFVSTRGEAEIQTVSSSLRDGYVELIRSLGYKVTCHVGKATLYGKDCGLRYRIKFTPYKGDGIVFLPRRADRLRTRPDQLSRSQVHRIAHIEQVDSVPVRCVVVEGGLYLAGDGWTATHNSETVANVVAACMIMLPNLAKVYPQLLSKYAEGLWVGAFGPVIEQSENLYSRIVDRLTSERALEFLADPDIDDEVYSRGRTTYLKRAKSLVRMQTAHPRARIEGRTYHLILVDECQDSDEKVINKSVGPMGASTNATLVFTGTPQYVKGVFYRQIQLNRRQETKRGTRKNHFQADYRQAGKYNKNYAKFVKRELLRLGADSDEFRLSYALEWLLDKGQFTTATRLDELGDKSMEVVRHWFHTPVLIGIDPARLQDSTVVTAVWVDWDNPDEDGLMEHRILNWLDLSGLGWEEQYFKILEFCQAFWVHSIGVDSGGLGDVVIDRLRTLMPNLDIHAMGSTRPEQSKRWKHLSNLMTKGMISWPAHAKTRRLKVWRRFYQQMSDLELKYVGPYLLAQAPDETDAHDDYGDSLSIACVLSKDFAVPEVETSVSPFYEREAA